MPVRNEEWMGVNGFTWFFGVVEDIDDPLHIGRVKVRCFGWHTENRTVLETKDLPWAQVMMPTTSASSYGVGRSPTGLLLNSQVVGFFMDGNRAQMPMIIGSFHGVPSTPDTPNLAYDVWESDKISVDKKKLRVEDVPTASRYKLSTSHDKEDADYELTKWSEPIQRGGKDSAYPSNHVTQTESGHAFEVDDTPGCERIHQYHRTGTYYEIQDDGSRATKIVGSDYEIVVKNKDVLIQGDCNVTIKGNARLLVEGDVVQEVLKDYHLTVHGNMITKIGGNDSKEILGSVSHQVNGDETRRITGDNNITVGKDMTSTIGTDYTVSTGKNISHIATTNSYTVADGTLVIAKSNMNIASGKNMNISVGGNMGTKVIGTTIHTYASKYSLTYSGNYHVNFDANTYTRKKDGGVDYSCPTDTRTGSTDCSTVDSI